VSAEARRGARTVVRVEVVADRTGERACDDGFLRLKRFLVRSVYEDGSRSAPYPCDMVSRPDPDAVAVAVYALGDPDGGSRDVVVVLRENVRPPVHFRGVKPLVQPDAVRRTMLLETVAGILEPDDAGPGGVERRAAHEAREEVGVPVAPEGVEPLGAELFTSPGVTDEKVHFRAARADLAARGHPAGDGSVMEEAGEVVVLPLADAIAGCRDGRIPNMVTEVALVRLAERLGYVPQLGRFVDELPPDLAARWRTLGLARAPTAGRGPGRR
jgi:ADP-ribose pyrophosphatase